MWRSGHNTVESWTGRKHSEETKRKISEANKGRVRTEEQKKRISEAHIGKMTGKDHHFYGKKLSDEHRRNLSDSHRGNFTGPLSSNWKGGIEGDFLTQLKNSYFYKDWRKLVLAQDDYRCQKCGSVDGLHAHHIIFLDWILDKFNIKNMEDAIECKLLWDINNGITYCSSCHRKYHAKHQRLQKRKE